ncbi:MAG: hypothetical protein KA184_22135 [Candidatus Hydrogenedentes bacterium]|nr:hypothetical protein [Candidatus Hydrogenedentota bacterium]
MSDANTYEDRTECVGTCMVCDPKCPVHALRARERAARQQLPDREPVPALEEPRAEE